jgi:hypothetical protein
MSRGSPGRSLPRGAGRRGGTRDSTAQPWSRAPRRGWVAYALAARLPDSLNASHLSQYGGSAAAILATAAAMEESLKRQDFPGGPTLLEHLGRPPYRARESR